MVFECEIDVSVCYFAQATPGVQYYSNHWYLLELYYMCTINQ